MAASSIIYVPEERILAKYSDYANTEQPLHARYEVIIGDEAEITYKSLLKSNALENKIEQIIIDDEFILWAHATHDANSPSENTKNTLRPRIGY